MAALEGLENKLNDTLGKNAPVKMPDNGKTTLVQWMPWISLIFGVIQLLMALALFNWARAVSTLAEYATTACTIAGVTDNCGVASRWTVWIYVGLAVLLLDALLLLASYTGLRDRKKSGWNFVFYSVLVNLVYGVVSVFSNYGSQVGSLIWSLITSVIGLWLLFQIRDRYSVSGSVKSAAPKV